MSSGGYMCRVGAQIAVSTVIDVNGPCPKAIPSSCDFWRHPLQRLQPFHRPRAPPRPPRQGIGPGLLQRIGVVGQELAHQCGRLRHVSADLGLEHASALPDDQQLVHFVALWSR